MRYSAHVVSWLAVRGRVALEAYYARVYQPGHAPMVTATLVVVCRDDFQKHIDICLEYAVANQSMYILDRDGSIFALLCRHIVEVR